MKPAVIVAGHICLDVIPLLTSATPVEPGCLIRVGSTAITSGGAVANTGIALHRLGTPVRLMATVGDDLFGHALLDLLRAHDESLADDMKIAEGCVTSHSIVISPPDRDRTFLHCAGVNEEFTASDIAYDRIGSARLFHFGYPPLMPAMCAENGKDLVTMFRQVRAMGLVTSLDMSLPDSGDVSENIDWHALLVQVLPHVDIFLPSLEEILFMLDRGKFEELRSRGSLTTTPRSEWERQTDRLLDMGVAVAGLKLGEQGLFVKTSSGKSRVLDFTRRMSLNAERWIDRSIYSPCFRAITVAGTTGSGDCTIAGFLAALVRGLGPEHAAMYATAVGACSVESTDATGGVPSWDIVQARIEKGWPRFAPKVR